MNLILYEKERDTKKRIIIHTQASHGFQYEFSKNNCISRENAKNKPYTIEITSLKMTLDLASVRPDKNYRSKDEHTMTQNSSNQK